MNKIVKAKATDPSVISSVSAATKPPEPGKLLQSLSQAQRDRVKAIAKRSRAHGRNSMKLRMVDDTLTVSYSHPDHDTATLSLMADLGTIDPAFYTGITHQIASMGSPGRKIDETNSNFLVSVVRAVQPRDEMESLLAVQMGAIHAATMMMARRLNQVDNIPQQDAAERALNKLARTFAVQMDTLKRYRSKGEQRVIVEHVTVNAGGQAIVGNVGGGGSDER